MVNDEEPKLEMVELLKQLSLRESKIAELERNIIELEQGIDQEEMAELEELINVVKLKDERIEELEEALRESVRMTAEKEAALEKEEMARRLLTEKLRKMDQRLTSFQSTHVLRCYICRPLANKVKKLESRLIHVFSERRKQLQDLARMK